jgi:hypothetical protein
MTWDHEDSAATGGNAENPTPDHSVAEHLESGLELARLELTSKLDAKMAEFCIYAAGVIIGTRRRLVLDDQFPAIIHGDLARPHWATPDMTETVAALSIDPAVGILHDPWLRYAAEIEIAEEGVDRTDVAMQRFPLLAPRIAKRRLSPKAQQYLQEVARTFLFGFDAACIALARATFEQAATQVLVEREHFTGPQLTRGKATAGDLIVHLKRADLLVQSLAAAGRLVKKGNTVLHHFVYSERILPQEALDCITDLVEVLAELFGTDSPG